MPRVPVPRQQCCRVFAMYQLRLGGSWSRKTCHCSIETVECDHLKKAKHNPRKKKRRANKSAEMRLRVLYFFFSFSSPTFSVGWFWWPWGIGDFFVGFNIAC